MNELQNIFNYQGQEVRTVLEGPNRFFVAKDICEVLGITNSRARYSEIEDPKKRKFALPTNGGIQKLLCFSEIGVKILLSSSRSIRSLEIARLMGFDIYGLKVLTREQATLETISNAFRHIKMEYQYVVNNYRIDLYFPDFNLAIECDENGHSIYPGDKETERQQIIEDTLRCKFIRFNPDEPSFNIGSVINQIMQEIYSNESSEMRLSYAEK